MSKITCLDIELAIMRNVGIRQNLIVPNITNAVMLVPFEVDMLCISKSGYATGFEIKVSKSDLKAEFKKYHHINFNKMMQGRSGLERYYSKFKYFCYAVPVHLKDDALALIPDFCGLFTVERLDGGYIHFKQARSPKKLFDYKWSASQMYEVARLGAMRIYSLKSAINGLLKERKSNEH